MQLLKEKDESATLLEVFELIEKDEKTLTKDYFIYSLINPKSNTKSFHQIEFLVMLGDIVVYWKKSKRMRPPKQ